MSEDQLSEESVDDQPQQGTPKAEPPQSKTRRYSPWAIVSLACGIIGFFTAVAAVPAVVFGHIARREFKRVPPGEYDTKMATIGLILGYVSVAFYGLILLIYVLIYGGTILALFSVF